VYLGNDQGDSGSGGFYRRDRVRVPGKQSDGSFRVRGVQNTGRTQAVHARLGLVRNHQVRVQFASLFDGVQAVYCFSTNLKIRFTVKIGADDLSDHRTIVNNENILWHVQLESTLHTVGINLRTVAYLIVPLAAAPGLL
jgi:hypothetical protein